MPEFDEFGIPIRKENVSLQNVDEFGIPIKKKEPLSSKSLPTPSSSPLQQTAKLATGEILGDISRGVSASPEQPIVGSIKEAAQKDKKNNESYLGALWNNAVASVARLAGGASRLAYATSFDNPYVQMERTMMANAGKVINKNLLATKEKEIADAAKGIVEKARTSSSSKEYEKGLSGGLDVTNGIGVSDLKALGTMIPQFVADMGLAVASGGSSFAIQGYDDALSMVDEIPEAQNISEGTRVAFGLGGALVVGALEKLGLDNIIKNPSAKRYVTAKVIKEATDELVKKGVKVTADEFEKVVANKAAKLTTKELSKIVGGRAIKGAAVEGGTEAIQEGGMDLLKLAANKIEGKEIFDEEEMKDTAAKRYLNSFIAGGVLGGLGSAVVSRVQNTENAIKSKLAKANTIEDVDAIVAEINDNVADGTITEDEAAEIMPTITNFIEVGKTLPETITGEKKVLAVDLIGERNRLIQEAQEREDQKKMIDPAFHKTLDESNKEINQRIEEINTELSLLANPEYKIKSQEIITPKTQEYAVQIESPTSVLQPTQERIGETGSERGGMEQGKQGEEVTPKSISEAEAKVNEEVGVEPIIELNKDNKQPFTTKSKKQIVSFENGDLIVRDAKTGVEVSAQTKKKALKEYAENFDFTVGEKAAEPSPDMQFKDENELNQYVIENSQNPTEIAEVYINQEPTTQPLSTVERMIADYGIGKVTNKSFERFGDRNLKGISMAKAYFNNQTGQSIDQVAKEMSDHYDVEITPQDIADFMVRFPNGEGTALKLVESEVASNAAAKFKELTGLNLNQEIAQKVIEQQFNKLSKAEQLIAQQDYESATQLEEAYWREYEKTNGFTEESPRAEIEPKEAGKGKEEPKIETKEGVKEPPIAPPTSFKELGERVSNENKVALEHAANEEKRAAYGMEERTLREVKKDEQLEAEANEAIEDGYDVKGLIKKITNKDHLPTDKEHIILLKYAAGLESKLENLDPKSKEFEEVFNELNATYKASEVGGSELGAAFRARQSRVLQEDALGEMLVREAEVNRVEELTPEQRENVVKEYEAIKKAKEEWEAKYNELQNKQLQKDAELEVQKAKRTSSGKKKTKEDFTKERQSIKDAIKDKWKKAANDGTLMAIPVPYAKQLAAISPDVAKLMKSYVEEGITDLNEIVSKIKDDVKDFVEDVTEKDIRDIIAGVYNEKRTKNQIASDLRDLRDEAKLLNQLEALENGEIPKTEKAKIERNQKITDLRNKIKELKKELIGGKTIDGEPINKKLKSIKTRLEKQIKELEEKLSKGDYSKEEKKPSVKLDKEAQELKDKLIKLKQEREIRLLQQEYANRTKTEKLKDLGIEVLNVPRTIMASVDFSAPLRQGIIATVSHPQVASKAFIEMFKQAASQKRFDRWFYDLRESPEYEIMGKAGLYIADPHDPKLSAKEEQFMNNLAEKIPFIGGAISIPKAIPFIGGKKVGGLIKGSERAYITYLNKMRADLFTKGAEVFASQGKTIANSEKLYKDLASFINNSTGRGKMTKVLEDSAPILNAAFFSPRLMASRINLMNPFYYSKLSPEVGKMATRDMARFLGFAASLLALAALSGADVETDPRSRNFMKIKIGDTVYDILGGFQQYMVELTRLLRGETKSATTGEIRKLSGKEFPFQTRGDELQGFVRGKLAPIPASTMNLLTGKKVTGERTDLKKEISGLLMPLNAKDAYEAFQKEGLVGGMSTLIPATFGVGVQNLSNIPENADSKKPEWKFISEKNVRIPRPDLETLKVDEEDREMTMDEIEKFVDLRTKKLEKFIGNIMKNGLYVSKNGEPPKLMKGKDIPKDALDDAIEKASSAATKDVKEEMFGKKEKPEDRMKKIADKLNKLQYQ